MGAATRRRLRHKPTGILRSWLTGDLRATDAPCSTADGATPSPRRDRRAPDEVKTRRHVKAHWGQRAPRWLANDRHHVGKTRAARFLVFSTLGRQDSPRTPLRLSTTARRSERARRRQAGQKRWSPPFRPRSLALSSHQQNLNGLGVPRAPPSIASDQNQSLPGGIRHTNRPGPPGRSTDRVTGALRGLRSLATG